MPSIETSDIVYLPYTAKKDKQGNVVMSSHTALETQAVGFVYLQAKEQGVRRRILAPGEYTFGPELPSTSALSRDRWIRMGVAEEDIIIGEGLNSTSAQMKWIREQGVQRAEVFALGFHGLRSRINMWKEGIGGKVTNAEQVISQLHPNKPSREQIRKLVEGSAENAQETRVAGIPSVYVAESFLVVCTALGPVGKRIEDFVRGRRGIDGPTVTDFHYIGPASAYPH